MKKYKKFNGVLLVLALIAFMGCILTWWILSRPPAPIDLTLKTDPKVIDFELKPEKESLKPIRLSQFRGKFVLLNFWASWCPPCIEELPSFLRFSYKAKRDLGIEIIAISQDESWNSAKKTVFNKNIWPGKTLPITLLLDPKAKVAKQFGTEKLPESYFIDKNQKVIRKFIGVQSWDSEEIWKWFLENSK